MKASLVLACLLGMCTQVRADAPRQYPVTKVVNLLKEMQDELEKEGEKDQEVDEKMKCWCRDTQETKNQAISAMESEITSKTGIIETSNADAIRLKADIETRQTALTKSKESLAASTAQRAKQRKTFESEEKEMEESVSSLDAALETLQKKQTSFLANVRPAKPEEKAMRIIHALQEKHADMLMGIITPHQRKLVLALTDSHVGKQAPEPSNVSPAFGEVVGVVSQMKDTFESNLQSARTDENTSAESFKSLKAAAETEITATEESLVQKTTQLAAAEENGAQAKEDLKDAEQSISTDKQFLADAKEKCAAHEAEYAARVQKRAEEIESCAKAQAILSDDAARDTFSRTFNGGTAFLQTTSLESHREKAANLVFSAASKTHNSQLAALAVTIRSDAFDKVKEEIDSLSANLKIMQQEEVTKKDSCTSRLRSNALDEQKNTLSKTHSESKLAGLQASVTETNSTMRSLRAEILEIQKQLNTVKNDTDLQIQQLEISIQDQREAQGLLRRAADELGKVYSTSFLQNTTAAAPEGFDDYSNNSMSVGVVALLERIIGDAKVLEAKATAAKETALKDYRTFEADSSESIAAKEKSLVDLGAQKAETSKQVLDMKQDVAEIADSLDGLSEAKSALKEECDFLLANFDVRQESRRQEIEALATAKAVLSGMQTDESDSTATL